jgi:hypothetical protein
MYSTRLEYQLIESICGTTGLDLGRELQITNRATIRWREKKEKEKRGGRKRKEGPTLFCIGVTLIDMT